MLQPLLLQAAALAAVTALIVGLFLLAATLPFFTTMSSSSQALHEDASSGTDTESTPIPHKLCFVVESLKTLTLNPLTHINYLNWFTQVEEFFDAASYSKYLDPTTLTPPPFIISNEGHYIPNPRFCKFNQINKTLLGSLCSTISSPLQSFILRHKTVVQFWTTLATHFQSQTRSASPSSKRNFTPSVCVETTSPHTLTTYGPSITNSRSLVVTSVMIKSSPSSSTDYRLPSAPSFLLSASNPKNSPSRLSFPFSTPRNLAPEP